MELHGTDVEIGTTKLFQSERRKTEECHITLRGLDMNALWQSVATQVGHIEIEPGHTLEEQIAADKQHTNLQAEIDRLERLARKETQPKKKFELVQKIKKLEKG